VKFWTPNSNSGVQLCVVPVAGLMKCPLFHRVHGCYFIVLDPMVVVLLFLTDIKNKGIYQQTAVGFPRSVNCYTP
jgi:hypothetical protein